MRSQVNNSVVFCGKPMESEEFLNRIVETLDITKIDVLKGDFVKGKIKS